MSDLVNVKTFVYRHEAELAQGILKDNNIESIVSADDAGGYRPHLSMGKVRLMVNENDAARAREILGVIEKPGGTLLEEPSAVRSQASLKDTQRQKVNVWSYIMGIFAIIVSIIIFYLVIP